jgi:hypothetical protein
MRNSGEFPETAYIQLVREIDNTTGLNEKDDITDTTLKLGNSSGNEVSTKREQFWGVMKSIPDYTFLIFLNYVLTFSIFPGIVLTPSLL